MRIRGSGHATGWSVAGLVNNARTQNGHIRNDTRDVSRRISSPSNSRICRRNCVGSDRACTRVTPRNLHGKEGVDGSSPSEGSHKVPANRQFRVVRPSNTRTHFGHICGTRDASRRRATPSDTTSWTRHDPVDRQHPCKGPETVVRAGMRATPSLQRGDHRRKRRHYSCGRVASASVSFEISVPELNACEPHEVAVGREAAFRDLLMRSALRRILRTSPLARRRHVRASTFPRQSPANAVRPN
jgi:hypothetical protein